MRKAGFANRMFDELRPVEMIVSYSKHADGSCLVKFGDTVVLCTASVENRVPPFLRNTGRGWITAEYGMLPRSAGSRMQREAVKGRQEGRTQEIQRLIGRSLRAIVDLSLMEGYQIIMDCDVIQADGGTRTAAINGGYVALCEAVKKLVRSGVMKRSPIISQLVAVSCGIVNGDCFLDLDYNEDSKADVDSNFVFDGSGKMIEIQSTAEKCSFTEEQFSQMLGLAKIGAEKLLIKQRELLQSIL